MEQSANSSLPSSLLPLCQNESECETIYIKMSSASKFAFMQFKLIFIMFCTRTRFETRPQKQLRNWPIYTNEGSFSRHRSFDSENVGLVLIARRAWNEGIEHNV